MSQLGIAYFLEDTDLSGGVRVVLAQADALIARGHDVSIVTKGLPLTWRRSNARWLFVDDFRDVEEGAFDFVIGTFWTTVGDAYRVAGKRAVHLCQGYEASFTAYADLKNRIESVYRLPIPKITVAESLAAKLRAIGIEMTSVGQIVDDEFFRPATPPSADPPRVILIGASEVDVKGIDVGYAALAHARSMGADFEIVRVSPWRPSGSEPVTELGVEFHAALDTARMVRTMHSCDVFLGPSREEEGFGLPAAEALASGIPSALTNISSFRSFAERKDYALFVDVDEPEAMGDALIELLGDATLQARLRKRGREVAEGFRSARVAENIEQFLRSLP